MAAVPQFTLRMLNEADLIAELQAFPGFLTGVVQGKRKPLTMALQAAGGLIRDQAARNASTINQYAKWWTKDYPKFWQYRWYETGSSLKRQVAFLQTKGKRVPKSMLRVRKLTTKGQVYTQQKRPTRRLYKAMRVKVSKLSTEDVQVVRVYVQFARKWDKWEVKNAWYGRFVEFGTGAQTAVRKVGKGAGHHGFHKPTKAYPFFVPAVMSSTQAAGERFKEKLLEELAGYKAKHP